MCVVTFAGSSCPVAGCEWRRGRVRRRCAEFGRRCRRWRVIGRIGPRRRGEDRPALQPQCPRPDRARRRSCQLSGRRGCRGLLPAGGSRPLSALALSLVGALVLSACDGGSEATQGSGGASAGTGGAPGSGGAGSGGAAAARAVQSRGAAEPARGCPRLGRRGLGRERQWLGRCSRGERRERQRGRTWLGRRGLGRARQRLGRRGRGDVVRGERDCVQRQRACEQRSRQGARDGRLRDCGPADRQQPAHRRAVGLHPDDELGGRRQHHLRVRRSEREQRRLRPGLRRPGRKSRTRTRTARSTTTTRPAASPRRWTSGLTWP